MIKIQTRTIELSGSNYEIGFRAGKTIKEIPAIKALHTGKGLGKEELREAEELFNRWCPGLVDELTGFADALEAAPTQIFYYCMTYLVPRCSQIAVLSEVAADGKPLLARNYEFSHEAEDFCLVKTSVKGKYSHIGTSVLQFGRDDGLNEHGLAVTMSSCGFPVGALPYMRSPKLKGLQFWAVIRALLENCKNVQEALEYLQGMPIAYNINLMLMDKSNHAALVETMDGSFAVKEIYKKDKKDEKDKEDKFSAEQKIWATNHAILPEIAALEPKAFVHSIKRYDWIKKELDGAADITKNKLKKMLHANFPDGLCCHYFDEYFGTTKSMIISPEDGTIELCWGGREENGWEIYDINKPFHEGLREIEINPQKADPSIYKYQEL